MAEEPPSATSLTAASGQQRHGALYTPLHVERRVKIYPIQEHELTTLGMFSTTVTVCSSIASGTFVFLLGIAWNLATATTTIDPTVRRMSSLALVLGGIVIAVCGTIGVAAFRKRSSELAKILSETRFPGSS